MGWCLIVNGDGEIGRGGKGCGAVIRTDYWGIFWLDVVDVACLVTVMVCLLFDRESFSQWVGEGETCRCREGKR